MRPAVGELLEDTLSYILIPKVAVSHTVCACHEATNIRDDKPSYAPDTNNVKRISGTT